MIVDVEATPARTYDEVAATKTMIERTDKRLGLKPKRLAADTAYGTGKFLGWLIGAGITPHIPVWEKAPERTALSHVRIFGGTSGEEFTSVPTTRCYTPAPTVRPSIQKNIGRISQRFAHFLQELRRLFISVQRPENINNLYLVVTSRRESKRAKTHRDWSHLALRKPATSRAIAGSYGGHSGGIWCQLHPPAPRRRCLRNNCPLLPSNQVRQFLGRDYASSSGSGM